jgi:hypothetical protein
MWATEIRQRALRRLWSHWRTAAGSYRTYLPILRGRGPVPRWFHFLTVATVMTQLAEALDRGTLEVALRVVPVQWWEARLGT